MAERDTKAKEERCGLDGLIANDFIISTNRSRSSYDNRSINKRQQILETILTSYCWAIAVDQPACSDFFIRGYWSPCAMQLMPLLGLQEFFAVICGQSLLYVDDDGGALFSPMLQARKSMIYCRSIQKSQALHYQD